MSLERWIISYPFFVDFGDYLALRVAEARESEIESEGMSRELKDSSVCFVLALRKILLAGGTIKEK